MVVESIGHDDKQGSIFLPENRVVPYALGKVLAVGPGVLPPKVEIQMDSGIAAGIVQGALAVKNLPRTPLQVKVGDIVMHNPHGGRRIQRVEMKDRRIMLLPESEIFAVLEEEGSCS